jgi:glycosyltransferase involved in cell wall biosynthesis
VRTALFLYTELAPYVLVCLRTLATAHSVRVHLVHWPVNKEAPFDLADDTAYVTHPRGKYDRKGLLRLVEEISPDVVFASGWVDHDYLSVCRLVHAQGKPTVMCSDTAWRGSARQNAALVAARFWLHRTFSHAWVTGSAQAEYARRLGFPHESILTGFYSADTERFLALGERGLIERQAHFVHRFLCVARYIPTKGHDHLCRAFAGLCDSGHAGDWELWIAGTGELHEQLTRSSAGSHPRIKHLGFVQAQDMPGVLARSGVSVLPSLYEPWGVVVHEHACAGLPLVLSTAVGAAERYLQEGENGHRFIAGDVTALRHILHTMVRLSDQELYTMGRHSMRLGAAWSPLQWAAQAMHVLRS